MDVDYVDVSADMDMGEDMDAGADMDADTDANADMDADTDANADMDVDVDTDMDADAETEAEKKAGLYFGPKTMSLSLLVLCFILIKTVLKIYENSCIPPYFHLCRT